MKICKKALERLENEKLIQKLKNQLICPMCAEDLEMNNIGSQHVPEWEYKCKKCGVIE